MKHAGEAPRVHRGEAAVANGLEDEPRLASRRSTRCASTYYPECEVVPDAAAHGEYRSHWTVDRQPVGGVEPTDTDFTAKLIDVYPPNPDFANGFDLNIEDSIVRARFRNGASKEELLRPGMPYAFTIEMYPTSLVFQRGHRIRLDVSSSSFPRFDVNPNTGEPLNNNRRWQIARNTIYLDAGHPSHIVLPISPIATTGSERYADAMRLKARR